MDASPQFLLMLAGAALCAVVTWGGVWMLVDDWRRRAQRRRNLLAEREAFREQIITAAAAAHARRGVGLAWQGLRDFRVSEIVEECLGVKSFYLTAADGRPLPLFHPGQYLTLHLPTGNSDKPIVRCYSLSDRSREEYYRITVKHCPPPTGNPEAPSGVGTTVLHSQVKVGDLLQVAAPRGDFFLRPVGDEPIVLIGAGIGVTPLMSMLLAQCHAGLKRETYVLLGMRNGREFPLRSMMADLARDFENIHTTIAYSKPLRDELPSKDYEHNGRLDRELVERTLPSNDFRYFLCGPPGMMESLVPGLLDWGVAPERIHFEAFGPASIHRSAEAAEVRAAVGAEVRFTRSGVTVQWSESDTSLLALAERNGVPLDAGCRVGNCGACAARLVEGGVAAIKTPGARPGDGECLTCVSVPTGSVVIEA